jgi:hypothetical protein
MWSDCKVLKGTDLLLLHSIISKRFLFIGFVVKLGDLFY